MVQIIVADRVTLPGSPFEVFEHVVAEGLPCWLIPPRSRLAVGTPIRIPMVLPSHLGGGTVEILGWVHGIGPGLRFEVHHALPWQGKVRVSVTFDSPGFSTVSLAVELNDEVIQWALQRMAPVAQVSDSSSWRVGLITSATGSASVFSVSARNTATMAVEEINADGGVAGRPLELLVGDDGTHPGLGAAELVRLAHSGCRVVVANVTSAVFAALRSVARRYGILIIHTPLNEGGTVGRELLRFGERPTVQSAAVIPSLMNLTGGSRFFLAGNDYRWPRAAHQAVRRVVEQQGGTVMAETYPQLGTTEFQSVISAIERSSADIVVSTFIGADEVAFEQQMHAAGMRNRVATLALVLDESTHDYIGAGASEGLWTAFSYFQGLDTAENLAFIARYRARFGAAAPPPSSMTQGVYDALHLVSRATTSDSSWDPQLIGDALRGGVEHFGPRGRIVSDWQGLQQPIYVAQSLEGALSPVDQILPDYG